MTSLSARRVETAKPGKYCDGDGLHLVVQNSGSRSWVFRYQIRKVRRDLGLGRWPDVSLQRAREKAWEMRALIAEGHDPKAARADQSVTFRELAQEFIETRRAGWKNAVHAAQWPSTLEAYVYPVIGRRAVSSIGIEDILSILRPIWMAKPETASRVRQRIEAVLDYATVKGARTGPNPAIWRGNLDKVFPARNKVRRVRHHTAVPWQDAPAVFAPLMEQAGTAARAVAFAMLTAARSGEVRGATWNEIDPDARIWTIPAGRMKAAREHRVPLSAAAVSILGTSGDGTALLFPSPSRKVLSDVAASKVLKSIAPGATVHGLRSTFRDWAGETTRHPREVIEHALAHGIKDKAEAAYARGTLFEKRRTLMADWERFLVGGDGRAAREGMA